MVAIHNLDCSTHSYLTYEELLLGVEKYLTGAGRSRVLVGRVAMLGMGGKSSRPSGPGATLF